MDGGSLFRAHVAHRIAYHITRESFMAQAQLDEFKRVMRRTLYRKDLTILFCDQCEVPYNQGEIDGEACNNAHNCGKILCCGRPWCIVQKCDSCDSRVCHWVSDANTCVYCKANVCNVCAEIDEPECCDIVTCIKCKPPPGTKICDACAVLDDLEREKHERDNHAGVSGMGCAACDNDIDSSRTTKELVQIVKRRRKN